MRTERFAMYGVPAVAGIVTAAVLLGPGRERPVDGLQVRALVAEGAERTHLELATVRHEDGQRRPIGVPEVHLELADAAGIVGRWEGATEAGHGTANLVLARPAHDALTLRASGAIAAEGAVAVAPPLPQMPVAPTVVEGTPRLSIWMPRGFAVPEMPEPLLVTAVTAAASARIDTQAHGASIAPPGPPTSTCEDGCVHTWRLRVVPTAIHTQLTIAVTAGEERARWQGTLPLAPGKIWLDPDAPAWRLAAPHPVEVAHLTLLSPRGRLWGTTVPMTPDARGFASGAVAPPDFLHTLEGPLAIAIGSDAGDLGGVVWPLPPYGERLEARPAEVVIDTLGAAIEAEEARSTAARRPAYGLVLAAGLFELVFLAGRARRSSRALRRHLEDELAPETARRLEARSPLWWLTLLTLGLVLAFLVLAGLVAFA